MLLEIKVLLTNDFKIDHYATKPSSDECITSTTRAVQVEMAITTDSVYNEDSMYEYIHDNIWDLLDPFYPEDSINEDFELINVESIMGQQHIEGTMDREPLMTELDYLNDLIRHGIATSQDRGRWMENLLAERVQLESALDDCEDI
jgi:hypothetical protein